jgi:hypothetical protein
MSTTPTTTTTITIPIDPATSSGWEAVRYLLRTGLSTPEQIADVLDGVSLIDGCVVQDDAPWSHGTSRRQKWNTHTTSTRLLKRLRPPT